MADDGAAGGYSDGSFWAKVTRYAASAGRELVEKALVLYFTLGNERCPAWAKAVIVGALGYFVLPVDAVPDVIPGAGYTDDIGAIVAASATVMAHVSDEDIRRAKEQADRIFGADE